MPWPAATYVVHIMIMTKCTTHHTITLIECTTWSTVNCFHKQLTITCSVVANCSINIKLDHNEIMADL